MPNGPKALNELKRFYLSHYPQALAAFNPPAPMSAIQTLEKKVRKALPSNFVACYQMHDGQSGGEFTFLAGHKWLPLHEISMDWSAWESLLLGGDLDDPPSRPDHQIQAGWWRSGWIPFTSDGGGTHLCVDLDPAEGGRYGQVIKVYHDMPHRQYLAADFGDWLARQVTSIINDR